MKGSIALVVVAATLAAAAAAVPDRAASNDLTQRQRRSFKVSDVPIIGSLFGEEKEEPEIPHLGKHPLWKVHRYHGISLQPIDIPKAEFLHSPPVPPTLEEEAPSIVNVPHYFAPEDHEVLPPNEYDVHHAPSGPYPPSQPAGPYPPSQPAGPYPPAAPYPAPEVHSSIAVEHPHPPSDHDHSHILDALKGLAGGHGGDIDSFSGLLGILPTDMVHRLNDFISTPEGKERASTLLGIASNAHKLKSGAARSLVDVFQRLFGGSGGSTDVAVHSGTYTKVPDPYPAHQGFLTHLASLGTGVSGHPIPDLPEVPELPEIPGLGHLPPAPQLPHINLPASHFNSGTSGKYVSINLPEHQESSHHTYIVPQEPAPVVTQSPYRVPAPSAPQTSYGVPAPSAPQTSYGVPAPSAPQTSYGIPAPSAPQTSYGVPAPSAPQTSYGVPAPSASEISYGTPVQSYATPQAPSHTFSPPAPVYSAPSQTYQIPSTSYGTPEGPTYPYQQGAHPAMTFQPSQHLHGHGFDSSLAASENHENHVEAKEEDEEEEIKEVSTSSPVTPRITKLHRVRNLEKENLLRGHARPFRPSLKDRSQDNNEEDFGVGESQPED